MAQGQRRYGQRGISLIEVAVAMTIAGLLLGAYLQYSLALREKARYENTQKRLGEVRTALAVFAAKHGRLPCPQNPLGRGASSAGLSRHSMEDASEEEKRCAPEAVAPRGIAVSSAVRQSMEQVHEVWTGVVPAQALKLKESSAKDGWGRLFTYAVSRSLTLPQALAGKSHPLGVISVVSETGENLLDKEAGARYVVISHGPSGAGAWTESGARAPCDKKAMDGKNCDDDAVFVTAPFSRKAGKFFFDDFLAHDDPDAGGTLLDKLMHCNMQRKFYSPQAAGADSDGCKGAPFLLEGACLRSETEAPSGQKAGSPPVALMPPAVAAGDRCGCKEGYKAFEIGTWDDISRTGLNMAWTNVAPGTPAAPNEQAFSTSDGVEARRGASKYRTRTSLYTCIQE